MRLYKAANSCSADVVERRLGRLVPMPKVDVEVHKTCKCDVTRADKTNAVYSYPGLPQPMADLGQGCLLRESVFPTCRKGTATSSRDACEAVAAAAA